MWSACDVFAEVCMNTSVPLPNIQYYIFNRQIPATVDCNDGACEKWWPLLCEADTACEPLPLNGLSNIF